ncbi:MAG: hypothetical protein JST32_07240 [Bacteroidetes bacterium]|nr:hypothetical protein [Bacteroidota bacterium]
MKPKSIISLVCILCFIGSNLRAQTKSEAETKGPVSYITTFFNIYKTQSPDKAFDYLSTKSNLAIWGDKWAYFKSKLDSVYSALGDFTGYELIGEKKVTNSLVAYSYIAKHKNYPVRFTFVFYKPNDQWLVHNIEFDTDDVIDELKQSLRIYMIDADTHK